MGFRIFLDSGGREWNAFDVVPRAQERRRLERRVMSQLADMIDDRRDEDRRITVGGRSPLASGVNEGWLCFERGVDRRRLTPIPDWGGSRVFDQPLRDRNFFGAVLSRNF